MTNVVTGADKAPTDGVLGHETRLSIEALTKTFQRRGSDVPVLKGVDIQVADGEFLVLLGPSGCGKSTLLRCIAGLERPTSGRLVLGESEIFDGNTGHFTPANKRDLGMVFQNYALWPHMKVKQNVAYPLKAKGKKEALQSGRVEEALRVVQCDQLAERYPPELSGGQQQRVALARAMAGRPSLMLLDEPLSNLDALLRIELRAQLRLLHRELSFTAIYVTHDQEEAIALGTRVAVMNAGLIEQIGPPSEVYDQPATEYVADFLGARNKLEIDVDSSGAAFYRGEKLEVRAASGLSGRYVLRLRDHNVLLRDFHQALERDANEKESIVWLAHGELLEVVPGTERFECLVDSDGVRLFAAVRNGAQSFVGGNQVDIGIDLHDTLCYNTAGELVTQWFDPSSTGVRT